MLLQMLINKQNKGIFDFCTSKCIKQTSRAQETPQKCPANTISFLAFYPILKLC